MKNMSGVGSFHSDQQNSTGGSDLNLEVIGSGEAKWSVGPSDRMQRPLVIHMETRHIGRLRSPIGCIKDIKQTILVAKAGGSSSTGSKDARQGEMSLLIIHYGNLIASGIDCK